MNSHQSEFCNNICAHYGIIRIVYKDTTSMVGHYNINLAEQLLSPNMILLVIENMALGILITHHQAFQLKYISCNSAYTSDVQRVHETGAIVIIINHEWSTEKWSQAGLVDFHSWFNMIEGQDLDTVMKKFSYAKIDVEFLKAMSWIGME